MGWQSRSCRGIHGDGRAGPFKKKDYGDKKIFIAKAIILASLSFKNLSGKLQLGINLLSKVIESDILEDGMHYLRSPSKQFIFLQSLVDIKNFI